MAKKMKKWSLFVKPENLDKRSRQYKIYNGINRKKEKRIGPITLAQAIQQARFGLVNKTVAAFKKIWPIAQQYRPKNDQVTSTMFKQIYQNAIRGDFPDFYIDYSAISICSNSVAFVHRPNISATDDGCCRISCQFDSGYLPALTGRRKELVYYVLNATTHVAKVYPRSCLNINSTVVLQAPAYTKGDELHVWILLNVKTTRQMVELAYVNTVLSNTC